MALTIDDKLRAVDKKERKLVSQQIKQQSQAIQATQCMYWFILVTLDTKEKQKHRLQRQRMKWPDGSK